VRQVPRVVASAGLGQVFRRSEAIDGDRIMGEIGPCGGGFVGFLDGIQRRLRIVAAATAGTRVNCWAE
jgi:hypothetical protein